MYNASVDKLYIVLVVRVIPVQQLFVEFFVPAFQLVNNGFEALIGHAALYEVHFVIEFVDGPFHDVPLEMAASHADFHKGQQVVEFNVYGHGQSFG